MMKLDGIYEFVYVAQTNSFTQAAIRLEISTAQVSRQVSALEKRLNSKLLYRTTRKVSLTQEGEIFYQHCQRALDGLDEAQRAIGQLQSQPQGKIKLTAPVTYGEQQILPLINNFIQQFPKVEVSAYLSNQQVSLVEEGYDLAIRLGKLQDSSMIAKKLANRINYVCASPAYLKIFGTPKSLVDLQQHNCLLGTLNHWRFQQNNKELSIKVSGSLRYNSGIGLLDAALKGLGLVQLPDYYVHQHIADGQLITLLDSMTVQDEGVWAVYPFNRQLSPKIKQLVEFLATQHEGPNSISD
jgi:DNA-binding transcriptional LysR family regulator